MQKNVETASVIVIFWCNIIGFNGFMHSDTHMNSPTTDFGYQQVPLGEKTRRVEAVFSSVASQYDLMNDLMSAGVHRLWKRFAIELSNVRTGQQVLDLAGGTGDLTYLFAQRVGATGNVCLADINLKMLSVGRDRLLIGGSALTFTMRK